MDPLRLIYREFAGFDETFRRQGEAFAKSHPGFALHRTSLEVTALYDAMVTDRGCLTGDHDLFLCVTDWLPEAIRDRLVLPLDRFLAADPPPNWPDGWPSSLVDPLRNAAGTLWAIPYHDGPEVLMYRADLFDDPREQERFTARCGRPLRPPATWREFREVAGFFSRPDDGLAGCVVAAKADGHNNVYDFVLQLWSRDGEILDAAGRPAFTGPEGEAALRFYQELAASGVTQPEPAAYDSVAAGDCFAAGKAAMQVNWIGFQSLADQPGGPIAGRVRSTLVPAGDRPNGRSVSLIVFWALTIPAGCPHPERAWAFLRHLATPEMDKITALHGGSGVRFSTWDDPEVRRRFPAYDTMAAIHRTARTLPATPAYPAINAALNRMMAGAVRGLDPIGLLREASDEVAADLASTKESHRSRVCP